MAPTERAPPPLLVPRIEGLEYFRYEPWYYSRPDALSATFDFESRARLLVILARLGLQCGDDASEADFDWVADPVAAPTALTIADRSMSIVVTNEDGGALMLADIERAEIIERRLRDAGVAPAERAM